MISVITPVFNGQLYISEVALSVLNQTNVDLEYILVDDGSIDSTPKILKKLAASYPHMVKVISKQNAGEAIAVNDGIRISSGEFICVVSADDPLLPGHLEKVASVLAANTNAVVAYPDWQKIDKNGANIGEVKTLPYDIRTLLGDFVCIPGPGTMIRRSAIVGDLRNPTYRFVSDYEAWMRLSLVGEFIRVPEVLALYRIHEAQATALGKGQLLADEFELVVKNFYKNPKLATPILNLEKRAIAFSSYYAGIQKLNDGKVPGRRRMLKSILYAPPFWQKRKSYRRQPLAVLAVLTYPVPSIVLSFVRREKFK